MKKETIKKIEENIVKQTTMPENLKNEVRKDIFKNLLLGIAIMVYFIVLIRGNIGISKDIVTVYFNIYSIILLIFSIILIEIAYRKNNGKVAVYGIEILIVALFTMFLPYVIFELSNKHQKYYVLSTSLISIYYIIKCIIINNRAKNVYEKEESDIDEITKVQKSNDTLLDEEMDIEKLVRRLQPNKKDEPKKVATKKSSTKKTPAKKTPAKKTVKKAVKEEKPKKETATKKTTAKKAPAKKSTTVSTNKATTKKAEEKKETKSVAKKTTTATKTTTKKKATSSTTKAKKQPAKVEPKKEETAPKKRGRPRKVVNN